jgi:hypothetical protein
MEVLKSKVYLIFYESYSMPPYKLWLPLDGIGVLYVGVGSSGPMAMGARTPDITQCFEWRTVNQAIQYSTGGAGLGRVLDAGRKPHQCSRPKVETGRRGPDPLDDDGSASRLDHHRALQARPVPGAARQQDRHGPFAAGPEGRAEVRDLGDEHFYNIDVIGEVVKDDRLIDNFKYRFDVPTEEIGGEKIPVTGPSLSLSRRLQAGPEGLRRKPERRGTHREALSVPEQPDAPPPQIASARADGKAVISQIKDEGLLPSAISLLPVAKEIITGLQRFETKTAEGVKSVDFYLNGSKVMTRTKAPFDADLNMGPLPRKQTVRSCATGPEAGRSARTNTSSTRGARSSASDPDTGEGLPRLGSRPRSWPPSPTPEGKALSKLEFYSNEARVATLYQAPYEQTVNIKESKSLGTSASSARSRTGPWRKTCAMSTRPNTSRKSRSTPSSSTRP